MFRYPSQGKLCFLAFKNFSPSFSSLIHCFTFCPHWSFSSTLSTPGRTSPGSQLHTELQSPVKTVEAIHSAQAPWLSRLKPFPLSDSSCLFTLGPGSMLLLFSMYFCLATQKSKPLIRESPTHTERRFAWVAGGLAVSHKLLNPCTWAQIRGAGCGAREIARLINCASSDPQHPCERCRAVVHDWSLALERQAGGSLELGGRVVFPNHRAPGPVRDSISHFKSKVESNSKHLPSCLHRNTLACSPMNVYMHVHACTAHANFGCILREITSTPVISNHSQTPSFVEESSLTGNPMKQHARSLWWALRRYLVKISLSSHVTMVHSSL